MQGASWGGLLCAGRGHIEPADREGWGGVAGREAAFTRRPFLTGAGALRGARDVTSYEAAQYQLSVLFRMGGGGNWGAARPAGCIWRGPLDRPAPDPVACSFWHNISSYRRCAHLGFPAASSSST
jgi:hypothetical protein